MEFLEITILVTLAFTPIFSLPIDGDAPKDTNAISDNLIESLDEINRQKKSSYEPVIPQISNQPIQCNSCCDKLIEERIYDAPKQFNQQQVYPVQCGYNLIVSCAPQVTRVPCQQHQ